MNKRYFYVLIAFLMILTVTSCKKQVSEDKKIVKVNDDKKVVSQNNDDSKNSEIDNDVNKKISGLDGKKYDKNILNNRPIVISIDNHPNARWQAGLSEAEIVYEIEVEYPYTRYLAVFQSSNPKLIGPVRSARPYLAYLSLEYNGVFTHVGGSQEAFQKIKDLKVNDIDGLYSSALFRYYDTNKVAPHNCYTTLDNLRKEMVNKKYANEVEFKSFKFHNSDEDLKNNNTGIANNIEIVYNKENNTKYTYDKNKKVYLRVKDGKNHLDENNNTQITAKNIIIYSVNRKVVDDKGRLNLSVIGQGSGYYITNGKFIEITWQKKDVNSKTSFFQNGTEIELNPGNTWIQVVSNNNTTVKVSE